MKRAPYELTVVPGVSNLLGECPIWHPEEKKLYWVDTRAPAILRREHDGAVTCWPMPVNVGSIVFRKAGGLVAALKTGFHVFDPDTGALSLIADPEPELPENRLNDGRCDPAGRYWCGTRDPGNDVPSGSLYRLDAGLNIKKMDSGFIVSNSMAFSPDHRTMAFGCSRGDTVWRYDIDMASGELSNKRVFIDTSGVPWRVDGATFDAEGFYWGALVGGGAVARFDPDGRLDRWIALPYRYPTMCNFGGDGLDTLFVTTGHFFVAGEERLNHPMAGAMFAIRGLGVRGVPEPLFAG